MQKYKPQSGKVKVYYDKTVIDKDIKPVDLKELGAKAKLLSKGF